MAYEAYEQFCRTDSVNYEALFGRFGKAFPAGTVLFEQGQVGQVMYVICTGEIEISRRVGERQTVLAVLPAGEFLGEMSLINNRPRSATARVVTDARVLEIDSHTFEAMIHGSTEIAIRLIKKLAIRLDETDRQIEVLLFRDPNSRVVHYLRQESERGTAALEGIAVKLTETEIAERLGLSKSEVETVISRLERAKLISRGTEGGFVVSEVGKLQDFLDFLEMKARYGST